MKVKIYTIAALLLITGSLIQQNVFATIHQVQVSNYQFNPSNLSVNVGDTVKWVWVSGSHTTTSTAVPAGAATWDQPITSASTSYSYRVTVEGTYNYECTPHAIMGMVASFTATTPVMTLAVTPGNQNVSAAAGTTSFNVSSNTSWSASCAQSWCICNSSGSGNGTISVSYSENTSTSSRIATITVTGSGVAGVSVTVTQAGAAPTLNVSPPAQNVSQASGTTNFSVSSNTNWNAASDQTWCTVTPSGSGNGTIVATYLANPGSVQRTALITVNVSGLPSQTVSVNQDGTVGISDHGAETFSIYPNPVSSKLNISSESLKASENELNIYNINSLRVMGPLPVFGSPASVDVSSLPAGVYFVRIGKDDTGQVRKIVKVD